MRKPILLITLLTCSTAAAQETPVAVEDFYDLFTDSTLVVDAPGVLANDSSDYPVQAILRQQPADGSVSLAADGSFVYTPNPGLTGMDSFTYVAATDEIPEEFMVDDATSAVKVKANLTTLFGTRADSVTSAVSGMITASVSPNTEPFAEIEVLAMEMKFVDGISLTFDYGAIAGQLTVAAGPDGLVLSLDSVGGPASVAGGAFGQLDNKLNLAGTLNITATGLIASGVTQGPTGLDVSAPMDINGTIVQNGSDLQLAFPVQADATFEVEGNAVGVTLSGSIVAGAPVATLVQSEPALVWITVTPIGTDVEVTALERFALQSAYPNPASEASTIMYQLPSTSYVSLVLYDALGRRVMTLEEGVRASGVHRVEADASRLSPGVYAYRLQAGSQSAVRMLTVTR
jgi:hypothetical protein